MGDIGSSGELMKCVVESTTITDSIVSQIASDNLDNQKLCKEQKADVKPNENKKVKVHSVVSLLETNSLISLRRVQKFIFN